MTSLAFGAEESEPLIARCPFAPAIAVVNKPLAGTLAACPEQERG
jgi:hypothetical protein